MDKLELHSALRYYGVSSTNAACTLELGTLIQADNDVVGPLLLYCIQSLLGQNSLFY